MLQMILIAASIGFAGAHAMIDQNARAALLEAARAPVQAELGKAPKFRVDQLHRDGDWAFLLATLQGADGKPFDYKGTPLADAAQQGMVSRTYAALLRHDARGWQVVAKAIGPSDVAWEDWPKRYGAPAKLFAQ
jgi:lambda repressor-like predicted transcriptional regulator